MIEGGAWKRPFAILVDECSEDKKQKHFIAIGFRYQVHSPFIVWHPRRVSRHTYESAYPFVSQSKGFNIDVTVLFFPADTKLAPYCFLAPTTSGATHMKFSSEPISPPTLAFLNLKINNYFTLSSQSQPQLASPGLPKQILDPDRLSIVFRICLEPPIHTGCKPSTSPNLKTADCLDLRNCASH